MPHYVKSYQEDENKGNNETMVICRPLVNIFNHSSKGQMETQC